MINGMVQGSTARFKVPFSNSPLEFIGKFDTIHQTQTSAYNY